MPLTPTNSDCPQPLAWNQATRAFPTARGLHALFEGQAARSPEARAVTFERQHLTYAALNARANQLAHRLRELGVGPESLVALSLERGLDVIVGILGILKAGGAYVPCDPDIPAERLTYILGDSQAAVLVTQESLLPRLGELTTPVVCFDRDRAALTQQPATDPQVAVTPENLAYVIYTSGSTGQPKGCCITHENAVRLFAATEDWFHFGPQDVWTLFHSFAFDFSVWEIWGALLYGGRLVVVPYAITRAPDSFYELLAEEKVTVLNQTPSAFYQLIAAEAAEPQPRPLALRTIIFGGEALNLAALRPWFERHGDAQPQLVNMYGITETTVHVTYRPLSAADASSSASVIGRAIPDLDLYVLDPQLQPCPVGTPGELHVGGAGLARGYLRRPELTAERFFANPHKPGGRLYKTGDLASYLPDGDIEYLGRIDRQVKIRGFRIELGEIEAALAAHPAIRQCVVTARDGADGDHFLAAYFLGDAEIHDLRDFLRGRLPSHMLPAAFAKVDSFPLTSNGKLDYAALPEPVDLPAERASFVAPQKPLERAVAAVWQSILGVAAVGIDDNFFDVGGTSLLLLRLRLALVAALKRDDLRIVTLFQHPTIRRFVSHLEASTAISTNPLTAATSRAAKLHANMAQRRLPSAKR